MDNLESAYWTVRELAAKNFQKYGTTDSTALVETVTQAVAALSYMFDSSYDVRRLIASVALSAAHAEAYERGLPLLIGAAPSTHYSILPTV